MKDLAIIAAIPLMLVAGIALVFGALVGRQIRKIRSMRQRKFDIECLKLNNNLVIYDTYKYDLKLRATGNLRLADRIKELN